MKQRTERLMKCRELAEWLSKGNGQYMYKPVDDTYPKIVCNYFSYDLSDEDESVPYNIVIRPYGETEWKRPTIPVEI